MFFSYDRAPLPPAATTPIPMALTGIGGRCDQITGLSVDNRSISTNDTCYAHTHARTAVVRTDAATRTLVVVLALSVATTGMLGKSTYYKSGTSDYW